jgi:hypothetical protein
MPQIKATINPDGALAVVKTADKPNPDGSAGVTQWDVKADQVQKHMRGIADASHPFAGMSAGDKSAALDAANETAKQAAS